MAHGRGGSVDSDPLISSDVGNVRSKVSPGVGNRPQAAFSRRLGGEVIL